jgi:transposase
MERTKDPKSISGRCVGRDQRRIIEAGGKIFALRTIFALRMKALLLRAVVLARRRKSRRSVRGAPIRVGWIAIWTQSWCWRRPIPTASAWVNDAARCESLFTFLEHPDAPPDNNGSQRELRPTANYRKPNFHSLIQKAYLDQCLRFLRHHIF